MFDCTHSRRTKAKLSADAQRQDIGYFSQTDLTNHFPVSIPSAPAPFTVLSGRLKVYVRRLPQTGFWGSELASHWSSVGQLVLRGTNTG